MEDKNRFSILLEHLLEVAEVKNYTLAKRLQYDVSYISKWVSGRMLPAKKTEKRVMEGISACVVDEATDDGRDLLLREYSVSIPSDLKAAIYDNLIAEYDYLQEELDSGEARIGPYTDFWAELNMLQYLTKMAHPVLRRVSQMDDRYMKLAEELLHGELSVALEIPKDEVKDYIHRRVAEAEAAG